MVQYSKLFYSAAILCLATFIAPLPSSQAKASQETTAVTSEKQSPSAKEGDRKPYELKDQIKVTNRSGYCLDCHRNDTPGIYNEWINSTHARVGVGCADCHGVVKSDQMGSLHADKFYISTIVTPFKCAKCHKDQMRDYFTSGHAKALELLKTMGEDDLRYPIVAQYKDDGFRQCGGCHGVEVAVDEEGKPDPATWPNSGAGRINPDRGHGTCAACHMGHRFSVAAARRPETCTRCHDGANYPEGDIYRSSAHGTLYATQVDGKEMDRPGIFFSGREMGSPTCSFCHFNGSGHGLLTRHNGAWRLPRDLTYPEAPQAERAENLRNNMKSVCNQCHSPRVIDDFFANADRELETYQKDVMEPGLAAYKKKLNSVEGEERTNLLKEYSRFLAEGKRFRMNLYMGRHGRVQR